MMGSIITIESLEIWLAIGCTLMIYSFLYKDNPFYKLGEYSYVGLTAAWAVCTAWYQTVWPKLIEPLYRVFKYSIGQKLEKPLDPNENLLLLIPLILGILILTRFSSKIGWLSRYTFAFIVGAGSGMAIPLTISAVLFKQMEPSLQPLWGKDIATLQTVNLIIILIGILTVLIYFFFSIEQKGAVKSIAKIGIFYMMVSFGAAFGYTVMARESLAIGRITKLVDWAHPRYNYATISLLVIIIALLVIFELVKYKKKKQSPPSE